MSATSERARRRVDPDALTAVVRNHLEPDVAVEDLDRLSGGASRETWSFTVVDGDGGRSPLILRRDPDRCQLPRDMSSTSSRRCCSVRCLGSSGLVGSLMGPKLGVRPATAWVRHAHHLADGPNG